MVETDGQKITLAPWEARIKEKLLSSQREWGINNIYYFSLLPAICSLLLLFHPHRIPIPPPFWHWRVCFIRSYFPGKVLIAQVAVEWWRPWPAPIIERSKTIRNNHSLKRYAGKAGTTDKSLTTNIFNAVWYGYAGKARTTCKSAISNAGNTVGYGYVGKSGTIQKSAIPNAGNADG